MRAYTIVSSLFKDLDSPYYYTSLEEAREVAKSLNDFWYGNKYFEVVAFNTEDLNERLRVIHLDVGKYHYLGTIPLEDIELVEEG